MFYLSAAAKNAADVESLALQAGLKKGGAAKGELVLAIFELANCFRQGWGINKDPLAAKQVCDLIALSWYEGGGHSRGYASWAGNGAVLVPELNNNKHGARCHSECDRGIGALKDARMRGCGRLK